MTLHIAQKASYLGSDWWDWAVWIEGTATEFRTVQQVTYFLHPTFPKPIRVVRSAKNRFKLATRGWGEFTIRAHAQLRDRSVVKLRHDLELQYPASSRRAAANGPPRKATRKDPGDATANNAATNPRVFLSYSAADARVAGLVKGELSHLGVTTVEPGGLVASTGSVGAAISKALSSSDAVLTIVSDAASHSAEVELGMARKRDLPIVPISVGNVSGSLGLDAVVKFSTSPTPREVKEKIDILVGKFLPKR